MRTGCKTEYEGQPIHFLIIFLIRKGQARWVGIPSIPQGSSLHSGNNPSGLENPLRKPGFLAYYSGVKSYFEYPNLNAFILLAFLQK
jgi:hypothetical protein